MLAMVLVMSRPSLAPVLPASLLVALVLGPGCNSPVEPGGGAGTESGTESDGGSSSATDSGDGSSGADPSSGGLTSGSGSASATASGGDGDSGDASGGGTGGDGDGDGDGDDSGGSIVAPLDIGSDFACDAGTQDCPAETLKCTPYVRDNNEPYVDAARCVEIIGTRQFGESCVRMDHNDDCDKSLFCMTETSGSEGAGTCIQLCDVQNDQCPMGMRCEDHNDGVFPFCE